MHIVIVDAGNYSRTPAAERMLRRALATRRIEGITVGSAGLKDKHAGDPPDPRTVERCTPRGIDLSDFRCRQIEDADFNADLILAMDAETMAALERRRPDGAPARIRRYLDAAGIRGDVPDPFHGGEAGFDSAIEAIEKGAEALADRAADDRLSRSLAAE